MNTLIQSFRLLAVLSVLTGVVYPATVTLVARLAFPGRAGGSLVEREGRVIGSELLAQRFVGPTYFWPRPSAGDSGTNLATVASLASQLGPTSADLRKTVAERAAALRSAHGLPPDAAVPADLLFASGSGLDPHVSPAAARFQVRRVASARGWDEARTRELEALVERSVEAPQFGLFGEPRVNVLRLNLALDAR
jgi:K+-transporting ATPase ATPase C chain